VSWHAGGRVWSGQRRDRSANALRLGDAEGFADHGGGPCAKDEGEAVDFAGATMRSPQEDSATGDALSTDDQVVAGEVGEKADEDQRGRDGQTLKVVGLASGVLGNKCDCGIEAGEAGEAAADEDGEDDGVELSAKTNTEGE